MEGGGQKGKVRVLDPRLDRGDGVPGVALVPDPVEEFLKLGLDTALLRRNG
jgi:hypothetical protein